MKNQRNSHDLNDIETGGNRLVLIQSEKTGVVKVTTVFLDPMTKKQIKDTVESAGFCNELADTLLMHKAKGRQIYRTLDNCINGDFTIEASDDDVGDEVIADSRERDFDVRCKD